MRAIASLHRVAERYQFAPVFNRDTLLAFLKEVDRRSRRRNRS